MERSFTARLTRPFGLPAVGAAGRAGSARGRPGAGPERAARPLGGPSARPGDGAVERALSLLRPIWHGRRMRVALLCLAIALPVLGGGYLLLRHSSFVAVQRVSISGVHGAEAHAIEEALLGAARHMSTLDVQTGPLLAAVAQYQVVSGIRAVASFPHALRLEVSEQLPVAALLVNGQRTAVAANGLVLGPALLSSSLPTLAGYSQPAAGQSLHSPELLESLALLGAAPRSLARRAARVYSGPQGLTVAMRNGLLAYFGDATRPHAKWLSLARVLADHSSAGASYVDVRLPSRPAAGFPAGSAPSSAGAVEPSPGSESAVGALAAGLTKESGANASAPASTSASSATASPPASGEASTSTSSTPPASSAEASTESHAGSGRSGEAEASSASGEASQEAQTPSG